MSNHDIYIFFLCLSVFIMLAAVFSFLITLLIRAQIKLIRAGVEDKNIVKEKQKQKLTNPKKALVCTIFERTLSTLIFVVLLVFLVFSVYINSCNKNSCLKTAQLKVVKSTSMSIKKESNKYLFENNLNDQIQMFDIIKVHPVPTEDELELYDIVVYEAEQTQIVHRIVGIEEPNEKHPDCKYFLLQGDAVKNPDTFPVLYSQIKGIYKGERMANVGSFVMFMQSPSGWLCILLALAFLVCEPLTHNFLTKEQDKRYAILLSEKAKMHEEN